MLNYLYFEYIEVFFSVYAWKGFWDLLDIGLEEDLLENYTNAKLISLTITALLGYGIFFFLIFIQRFHMSNNLKEILHFFAYISIVSLWRTYWDGMENHINNI